MQILCESITFLLSRHDERNMDVIIEGVVTKQGTQTVLEAGYTEPLGDKGPRLSFQGHSTINVSRSWLSVKNFWDNF